MMAKLPSAITVSEATVVIRERGSTHVTVANILGRETRDGVEHIWLDRLIHDASTADPEGWTLCGAISTVMIESEPPATADRP